MNTNTIYCGDNLEIMAGFPEKSIDLIYADPPFFTHRNYEVIWGDTAEKRAFDDRWSGGVEHFIRWMRPRIRECHRLLKDTGTMYLHCDWHANAHLRLLMDEIFGQNNHRNEIIWSYNSGSRCKLDFGHRHDTIFRYSKTDTYLFNPDSVREAYSPNINIPKCKAHYYNPNGKIVGDVWQIPIIAQNDKTERIGYPTQKPEALLKRIIQSSSNEGCIVFDPFCGCGTTVAAAQLLQRKWVGVDISLTACITMKKRLEGCRVSMGLIDVPIINMPTMAEDTKKLKPFEFQNWVIYKIKGTHQNKRVDDKGIDGWTFMQHDPVQIKQSYRIGRNIVDNFETAMKRVNAQHGIIYAFSFTKGANEESARAEKDGLNIELLTIDSLFKENQNASN